MGIMGGMGIIFKAENKLYSQDFGAVLDFFNSWYIDSVCEDKALHQV